MGANQSSHGGGEGTARTENIDNYYDLLGVDEKATDEE